MRLTHLGVAVLLLPSLALADLSSPQVYLRTGPPPWRPLPAQGTDHAVAFRLDPSQTAAGRAVLLINPPRGMDINDTTPPRITGVSIDGKGKAPASNLFLGAGNWQPGGVCFSAFDAENGLGAAECAVDGAPLRPTIVFDHGSSSFAYELPRLEYGRHTLTFTIRDNSPQANEATLSVSWERYDPTDFAHAASGATLKADSFFAGYPSLAALQDGKTDLPGDHCLNDISWASAETPEPHWVEVDFGRPRRIHEVTLCWALFDGKYHTATRFEVQAPADEGWRTIGAPANGLQPAKFTTVDFPPVTTSRVRVLQPAGAGPVFRPNLMWLAEVLVR